MIPTTYFNLVLRLRKTGAILTLSIRLQGVFRETGLIKPFPKLNIKIKKKTVTRFLKKKISFLRCYPSVYSTVCRCFFYFQFKQTKIHKNQDGRESHSQLSDTKCFRNHKFQSLCFDCNKEHFTYHYIAIPSLFRTRRTTVQSGVFYHHRSVTIFYTSPIYLNLWRTKPGFRTPNGR